MRPISFLSIMAIFLATGSASIIMSEQQPMREDAPVHTSASWEYTDCGYEESPVQITSLQVKPDPPKPGQDLTVIVDATVTKTLKEGAYADVTVKLGLIKLLQKTFDLCDEARNANTTVQCPVEPGLYHIEHTVALPKEIPPAKFSVNVRGYTADDEDMICLDLKVDFMRGRPLW